MSPRKRGTSLAVSALLLAALASPLQAQSSSRWLPFIGCWEPLGAEDEAGLLCFRPSGDGVEMSNVVEGEMTAVESMIADGIARSINAEGCTGAESVDFSADGRRVFTSSSFVCAGGETRDGTGVMSFISPTRWIDVRSLTVDGEPVAWVQRYSAATTESLREHDVADPAASNRAVIRSRRVAAARDIVISDVEEAAARIHPQAVKVWVATHDTELDLTGRELVRLADAGIPEDVIDVMVAVSYPERFAVTPDGVPAEVAERVGDAAYRSGARVGYRSYLWDPFYAPFGYRYSRFGYYGYGGGFYGGGYYGYRPTTVIVVPRDVTPGRTGGSIVNGQGYRGRPSAGSGSSRSSGPARSGGSSGDSGASSGGSTSGSSTPRRTAVPR